MLPFAKNLHLFLDRKIRTPDNKGFMLRFPLPFFLIGICVSLMLAHARAETSRDLPAKMGAALWLKADERLEFNVGGNGTVVSTWQSKVGNLTATQSSNESARIEGNQTTANNKDAIFFPKGSGASGYGYFEIPSNFNLKNSTVLVSLKHAGASEAPRVLSFSTNSNQNDGQSNSALALMFYKGPNIFRVESNLSGPGDPKAALSPSYNSGNWTVLSYRIDGNGNMTVVLDGVAGNQTSNPSMATTNTGGKTRIGLGSSGPNATTSRGQQNLTDAHIYEILIFNKYLNDNDNEYSDAVSYMQESMDASSVQVSPPTASAVNRGESLSQSILSGGNASSNGMAVDGNFTWSDNSTTVTQSGNYSVIFVPDLAKYNFSGEVEVLVKVNPELNTSTKSLTGFRTLNGTASPSKSVSISGTNLTSNVVVSFSGEGFEVSEDPMGNFTTSIILPVTSGTVSTPLHVRLAATATIGNNKTDTLLISSSGNYTSVSLSGDVIDSSLPYISITPKDLTLPVTTTGTPSASANFTVNAYNLSGNLTANVTAGLEISLGNGTFSQTLVIPLTGGNVTTSLNLRVAASASAGALPGSVTLTSGNTTASLSANGTVNAPIQRTLPAPVAAAESSTPENSNTGKKIKKQKLKKKPKKKKKSVFSFPQVVATSGSTWITAGGNVVSEQDRAQSNTSK